MLKKIMELLRKEGFICAESIAISLGLTVEKARSLVQIMVDQGLIQMNSTELKNGCSQCTKSCSICQLKS